MASVIVPVLVLGSLGLLAFKSKRTPVKIKADESLPITEREGYGQAKAYYDRAMAPEVRDLTFLAQTANWETARGFPEFAEPILNKWRSIRDWEASNADITKRPGYGQALAYRNDSLARVNDPAALETTAAWLASAGFPEYAAELRAKAASLRRVAPSSPPVALPPSSPPVSTPPVAMPPSPPVASPPADYPPIRVEPADDGGELETPPGPPPPPDEAIPPVAREETEPDVDTRGSVALARLLIAREGAAGWKSANQTEVRTWQTRNSLTPDGMLGPTGLVFMGEDVGILPRVRYWPKSDWDKARSVETYRARIRALADRIEPENSVHAAALRISAERETGQGWPTSPTAVPAAERVTEAALLASALESLGGTARTAAGWATAPLSWASGDDNA